MTRPASASTDVLVAGVPWPRYKLLAVISGLITLLLVGTVTASAAAAVLGAATVAVTVGLLCWVFMNQRD